MILEPGIGPVRAAALLPSLAPLAPEAVWLFGWCGGLSPDLAVGDLVLAEATLYREDTSCSLARAGHPPPGTLAEQVRALAGTLGRRLAQGPVLSVDRALRSVEEKRAAAVAGAVAVEMEAAPLARWAGDRGLPFFHLRVVLDPVDSALPPSRMPMDGYGRTSTLELWRHVLGHPGEWGALRRVFRQARAAQRVMTRTVAVLEGTGALEGALGGAGTLDG